MIAITFGTRVVEKANPHKHADACRRGTVTGFCDVGLTVRFDGDKRREHMIAEADVEKVRRTFKDHMLGTYRDAWLTARGELVMVDKMKSPHLINTMAMIRRWGKTSQITELLETLALMPSSNFPMGEHARDALESELDAMSCQTVESYIREHCPPWERMCQEMRKRFPVAIEDDLDDCLVDIWGKS